MSYRSMDRETVRTILRELEDIGHEVWSDVNLPDHDWWERVLDGIRSCDLFVFGLTPHWFASDACLREFDYATALGKNRLPIRLAEMPVDAIPPQVQRLHIVHYDGNTAESFRVLQRAINRQPPPAPLPAALPEPPRTPVGDLDRYDQQLRQMRLERDAQAAMVFELKRALRRRDQAAEARALLNNLRKHPDTTESVANRIDMALSGRDGETRDKNATLTVEMLPVLPENPPLPARTRITPANAGALQPIHQLTGHINTVYAVAFSPDGLLLATASGDKSIRLYNLLEEASDLALLRGHHAAVRDVAFSPDSTQIASASADNSVRLWGIRRNRDIHLLESSDDWVLRVAFSPRGDLLAATSVREITTLWNTRTQEPEASLGGHADWVSGVDFSPDGTTLVTASYDQTIRFWNVARRRRMQVIGNAGGMVEDIRYTPDGTALAAAMQDGTIRLWSAAKLQEITRLRGHQHAVYEVAFGPEGKLMVSVGADGTLRVWDMVARQLCATYAAHNGPVWSVAVSVDGGLIATGGEDGVVKVWAVPGTQA